MTHGIVEYVVLRMARRFLFRDRILRRVSAFVPYYLTNVNEVDAAPVVKCYESALERSARALPESPRILEVGSGATNSVGYALAQSPIARPGGHVFLYEPFSPLDHEADARVRRTLAPGVAERVHRLTTLDAIESGSVDMVLSHSVLEHVRNPEAALAQLDRVLAPDGVMVHAVDYRDHFFKYPYHFLLFSRQVWDRWLDPGDLPRWRLGDHLRTLAARGFRTTLLDVESLPEEFSRVAPRVHPEFDRGDPNVAVARATILATRPPG